MNVATLHFAFLILLTVIGTVASVTFSHVFHNALGLAVALLGIAGIYVFLGAEFIAAVQLIIYVGAIAVAIIYAIMVAEPLGQKIADSPKRTAVTGLVAIAFFTLLLSLILMTPWRVSSPAPTGATTQSIGYGLLTRYLLPFELISVVLLVAIVGALVIARPDRNSHGPH